jgi:hypothetical protein
MSLLGGMDMVYMAALLETLAWLHPNGRAEAPEFIEQQKMVNVEIC